MTNVAHWKHAPLYRIWRFVPFEKRLTRSAVIHTDIPIEISRMFQSAAAPMGLRLNSQLLLGITMVYKQKARYLLEDCDQILTQILLMHQRHVQTESSGAMQSSITASPEMALLSGAQSSPKSVSRNRSVADDLKIGSDMLESKFQDYIMEHRSKSPKRTFAAALQADLMKVSAPEYNYDSDYGDVGLDLDIGESPLSIASPVMRSFSCSMSPASPYQHTQTLTEIRNESTNIFVSKLRKNRKRQRISVLEDQETVIPLADLKRQQLDRSGILKPHAPRGAALLSLQYTMANDFALSLFQGPRHCAPELKQYLSIDSVRANTRVELDHAANMTTHSQPREIEDHGDESASNQTDYTPFEVWSDEETQPYGQRLISTSETRRFQDVVFGMATQDVSAWFWEILLLATQGAIEVEQKTPFGDIWINEPSRQEAKGY